MTIMAEVIEQENKKKQTNEGGSNDENNNNNGQEEELFFDCLTISEDEYANIIPKDMDLEDGLSLLCLVNEVRFQTGLYRNPSYPLSKCFQYLITYYETETEITSTSTSTNTSTSFMENNSSNNNDNHNHKEQRGRITKLVLGPMPGTTTYDTRIPELPPMIEQFQQLQSLELHGFRQLPKELNNLGSHCLQSLTLKSCVPSLFFNMPTAQQFTKLGQNLKYIQLESNDFIRYQPTFDFITKQLPNLETLSLIGSYPNNEQDTPKILTALLGGDTKDACAFQHTLKVLELQQMGINETQLIHSILYGIAPLYTNLTELHLMYNNVGSLQPLLTIIQQQKQQQQQQQEMTGDGRRPSSQAPQPPLVNTTTLRTINLSQNPIADQIQQKFNEKEETILPKEEKDAILYLLNTFTGISNLLLFENKDPPSLWRRRVHPREERHHRRLRDRNFYHRQQQQQQTMQVTLRNNNTAMHVEVMNNNNNDNVVDHEDEDDDDDDDDDDDVSMNFLTTMFQNMYHHVRRNNQNQNQNEEQQQQQQQVQAQAQAQQEPEQEDEPPETLLFDSDIEYLLRINHAGRKYITPSTQSHYHHAGEGEEEEEEGKRTVEELHEEELLTKNETSKKDDVDGTITFVKKIVHDNDKEVTPSSSSSSTPSLSPSITPNNIIKPQLWPLILERAYNKSDEITVYVKQDNSIAPRTAFTSRYGGPRGSIIAKKKKAKCPTGMHYMIRHGSVLQDIIAARRNDM